MTLNKKTVFITGASSGIGKACAEQFAAQGCRLILTARRLEKLQELAQDLEKQFKVDVLPLRLDVQDKAQVSSAIEHLPLDWKQIDVLVNNAGVGLTTDKMQDANIDHWDTMIDTNIRGFLYVIRNILPDMVARNNGHIINIGSVAGHGCYPGGNVYSATKHAVKALNRSLRLDLLGMNIRVTEIAPGAVETEFSIVRWGEQQAKEFYQDFTPLVANDIADAVLFCATRPPHVDISEMLIYPVAQASCNHLHKEGKNKGVKC